MGLIKAVNLTIAFLLELFMLAALAFWGFRASDSLAVQLLLGLGAPLLVILIWARFMAPKATGRLTGLPYYALKALLFGAAALALAAAGQATLAVIFAMVALVNELLMLAWRQ